jgi:hypothetical protein
LSALALQIQSALQHNNVCSHGSLSLALFLNWRLANEQFSVPKCVVFLFLFFWIFNDAQDSNSQKAANNESIRSDVRQMAIVCLKNAIYKYWRPATRSRRARLFFSPPIFPFRQLTCPLSFVLCSRELSSDEKAWLRQRLLVTLLQSDSKV